MSLGVGAYKVGGPRQCSSMSRRSPWQPCERPPPGTITLNNSVEYLPTHYLPSPYLKGEEGMGKINTQTSTPTPNYCIAKTPCVKLRASSGSSVSLASGYQLVEHRIIMREVVSSTPAGPTLRVLKITE